MNKSKAWDAVPQYAKDKYYAMCRQHEQMCANKNYEPREAVALRRQIRMFYDFQCEAARKKLEKAVS